MVFEWEKEIFLQITSSEGNSQELFDMLTTDSTGDVSESAKTIKEGERRRQYLNFESLAGQPE